MDGIRRRKLEFRRLAPNPANEISRVTSPIWQSLRKRIWADPKAELCLTTGNTKYLYTNRFSVDCY